MFDAHVSGPIVGRLLTDAGHDVFALDQHVELEGLPDEDVLELARLKGRILITHDVADFPAILRQRAESGRPHAGVILVYGIRQSEFELTGRGVLRLITLRPNPSQWGDYAAVLDRSLSGE